jgi:hypothetical protein
MAAPVPVGNVLQGRDAWIPSVRMLFRFYGTRDVVLGLGTLRAAATGGDVGAWLAVGIASDALDAGVMLTEWNVIPKEKRVPGLLTALSAGALGAVLLARRPPHLVETH